MQLQSNKTTATFKWTCELKHHLKYGKTNKSTYSWIKVENKVLRLEHKEKNIIHWKRLGWKYTIRDENKTIEWKE